MSPRRTASTRIRHRTFCPHLLERPQSSDGEQPGADHVGAVLPILYERAGRRLSFTQRLGCAGHVGNVGWRNHAQCEPPEPSPAAVSVAPPATKSTTSLGTRPSVTAVCASAPPVAPSSASASSPLPISAYQGHTHHYASTPTLNRHFCPACGEQRCSSNATSRAISASSPAPLIDTRSYPMQICLESEAPRPSLAASLPRLAHWPRA